MERAANSIRLHVNGKAYVVENPELGVSLNTWLRSSARITGTKVMCAEGGCGSCIVMITRADPGTGREKSFAANSCLFPLLSVDGYHITTTEGLIEDGGQYNAIQERVAHFNATQCGYCTPGFVMTMHSLLQRNPHPTKAEIEAEFDGNLCRCTGYRPIFDAMKSFASDADPELAKACADIEDLKICRQQCNNDRDYSFKSCGRYEADGKLKFCHKKREDSSVETASLAINLSSGDKSVSWIRPLTFQDLTNLVKEFVLDAKVNIRFVVGYTSTGVYKSENKFDVYIDTKNVKELYNVESSQKDLRVGANVSLRGLIEEFEDRSSESEIFAVMAKHIRKVAHVSVRNVACWAGNIMVKKLHPEFPSDIFTLFSAFNVTITVLDCMTGDETTYSLTGPGNFIELDMTGKVILACKIPKRTSPRSGKFKALSYKVMPRAQNAHAYVNAAFSSTIVDGIVQDVAISFGGIRKEFARASETEGYLVGKDVNSQETLSGALKVLDAEVQPVSYSAVDSSLQYRKSVTLGLFYKFFLYLCEMLPADLASAIDTLDRPVTRSTRTYDSDTSMYPVTEPIPKLSAIKQASGEAVYLSDTTDAANELHATYVMAEIGNADIDVIDSSYAETMPGFHSIITASNLPTGIQNTFTAPPQKPQVILADGHVEFAGQPVAIVLADTEFHAEEIAKVISVSYKNQGPVVCELEEAIVKQMFYDVGDHFKKGDASEAFKNAPVKLSGRVRMGSQYHFYMETQVARAIPTEDGFEVRCATQWQDGVQHSCANIFGWDSNRIRVRTGRIGGAFGGKAMTSFLTASIVVVSSYISGRPVRFHSSLSRCMETYGRRSNYVIDYNIGADDEGTLQSIEATYYANSGVSPNDPDYMPGALLWFSDSGYYCPNWRLTAKNVRTNTASTTWCRAPVSAQSLMFMEMIMEHVAKAVKQNPIVIKQRNLYKQGQCDISGKILNPLKLREISKNLLTSIDVEERQRKVEEFNQENKWKKKGLGFMPLKYLITWEGGYFSSQVSIYASDGSVILSTGAVDSGQGISTKLIQVASYVLGVSMDLIRLAEPSIVTTPNSAATSASFTSEICSKGILKCCQTLKSRIEKAAEELKLPNNISWKEKIAKCFAAGVDLTANYWVYPKGPTLKRYDVCGAAMSEVEMDILTGEFALRKVDIMYDCGKSVNPEIDVGQAEGAFIFGLGYFTSEKLTLDPESGRLLSHNTWEYKPPSCKDIPTEWNITFLKDESNPNETLSSKASGEPPQLLSASVVFAIMRCIESFRKDGSYLAIDIPAGVDRVQQLCDIKISDYTL